MTDIAAPVSALPREAAPPEGIERPEQANLLRRLECGLGQGYHFSRPLSFEDAEEHIAATAVRPRSHARIHAA